MQKLLILLLGLLLPNMVRAQTYNLALEQVTPESGRPAGWAPMGNADAYEFQADSLTRYEGRRALRIRAKAQADTSGFGAMFVRVPARYVGKQITLSGYLKTADVQGWAGLWLRIDDANGQTLAFDNMQPRRLGGTRDWQAYTITLPLGDAAEYLYVGGLLAGKGTVWLDALSLRIDGQPLATAPLKPVRQYPAARDTAFRRGSGLMLDHLSPQQLDHLAVLGQVWGFVKYHHPAVAAGNYNWDAELFRIVPAVLASRSAAARNRVLGAWVAGLGPVPPCPDCRPTPPDQIRLRPDTAWLSDRQRLGAALSRQLLQLRTARRPGAHYYVNVNGRVGNPEFLHEDAYADRPTPDAGYRLLALFRYWNIIEYYFPYRYAIGEDWQRVLPEFIPKMLQATDPLQYRLTALALIARIHDTHANLWGNDPILSQYRGSYYAPVQVRFVEGQAVVTDYLSYELGQQSGLRLGDVITHVEGVAVAELLRQQRPLLPASNDAAQRRNFARDLLRGTTAQVHLQLLRAGRPLTLTVPRYSQRFDLDPNLARSKFQPSFRLLTDEVGYLSLANIKSAELPGIMESARCTKGLVIDIRNYPADFVVFALTRYLLPQPTPFARFSRPAPGQPGLFVWADAQTVPASKGAAYAGKVVILVNETTQSSAEYHAMALRTAPGATVLGSTTAGADGNVSHFYLPGGLSTLISGIGVYYPDGRETQRVGIVPDVEVCPTITGVAAGRDELLEQAVRLIEAR